MAEHDTEEGRDEEGQEAAVSGVAETRPWLLVRKQQLHDRGKRSTGLGVRGALLPQDGEVNMYPLGETNILPHLEEREMKR